jgi:hypothetical protein
MKSVKKAKITLICIPPHSSHVLQPLDIGCFAALKRAYSRPVEFRMRCGSNRVDKLGFLEVCPTARMEAFESKTVQTFKSASLIPFAPERVISKLSIELATRNPLLAGVVIGIRKRPRTICKCKIKLRQSSIASQNQEASRSCLVLL